MGSKPSSQTKNDDQLNSQIKGLLLSQDQSKRQQAFEEHIIPTLLSGDKYRIKHLMHELYIQRHIYDKLNHYIQGNDILPVDQEIQMIHSILNVRTDYLTEELLDQLEFSMPLVIEKLLTGDANQRNKAIELIRLMLASVSLISYKTHPSVITLLDEPTLQTALNSEIMEMIESQEVTTINQALDNYVVPILYSGYYDKLVDQRCPRPILELICQTTKTLAEQNNDKTFDLYIGRVLYNSPSTLVDKLLEEPATINIVVTEITKGISKSNTDEKDSIYKDIIRPVLRSNSAKAINQILQNTQIRAFLVERIKNQTKEETKQRKSESKGQIFNLGKDAEIRLLLSANCIEMTSSILSDPLIRKDVPSILDYSWHDQQKAIKLVIHILEACPSAHVHEILNEFTREAFQSEIERLIKDDSCREEARDLINRLIVRDPGDTKLELLSTPALYDFMRTLKSPHEQYNNMLIEISNRLKGKSKEAAENIEKSLSTASLESENSFFGSVISLFSKPGIFGKSSSSIEKGDAPSACSDGAALLPTADLQERFSHSSANSKDTNTSGREVDPLLTVNPLQQKTPSLWEKFSETSKEQGKQPKIPKNRMEDENEKKRHIPKR